MSTTPGMMPKNAFMLLDWLDQQPDRNIKKTVFDHVTRYCLVDEAHRIVPHSAYRSTVENIIRRSYLDIIKVVIEEEKDAAKFFFEINKSGQERLRQYLKKRAYHTKEAWYNCISDK